MITINLDTIDEFKHFSAFIKNQAISFDIIKSKYFNSFYILIYDLSGNLQKSIQLPFSANPFFSINPSVEYKRNENIITFF